MPVDFQKVREEVIKIGERAPEREKQLQSLREKAAGLLEDHADNLEALRKKVERAAELNKNLRCAVPFQENLAGSFPLPDLPAEITVIAADGSQIYPDPHGQINYCLVNVGAIYVRYGVVSTPEPDIDTQLFYDETMFTEDGFITEGVLAVIRDQRERQVLAQLAGRFKGAVVTLADGPIELWEREHSATFARIFRQYLESLQRLHKRNAATAGYVDSPRSDLVVRLLEVAILEDSRLEQAGVERPLRGVSDVHLYKKNLPPGERSAIFAIQSRSAAKYPAELALHFFYLNVGREGKPWLVRVEIPAWVAEDKALLDGLHATLIDQCRILGNQPYPYVLHRAHETALVTRQEEQQVKNMIALELRKQNVEPGEKSPKQTHKDAV
jgi:hypothetical protein